MGEEEHLSPAGGQLVVVDSDLDRLEADYAVVGEVH